MDTDCSPDLDPFLENREELVSIARAVVGDAAVAEELVQESWIRWQGRGYGSEAARRILHRIVRNLAFDLLRRRRVEAEVLQTYAVAPESGPDAEQVVVGRDQLARVAEALADLPERTRIAFTMSCIERCTYAEIAERLEISRPRAHQLVRQALVKITLRLNP
ncbi:MAG: RNA polymerase sigma factor [Pseudomonadota bacterium]